MKRWANWRECTGNADDVYFWEFDSPSHVDCNIFSCNESASLPIRLDSDGDISVKRFRFKRTIFFFDFQFIKPDCLAVIWSAFSKCHSPMIVSQLPAVLPETKPKTWIHCIGDGLFAFRSECKSDECSRLLAHV